MKSQSGIVKRYGDKDFDGDKTLNNMLFIKIFGVVGGIIGIYFSSKSDASTIGENIGFTLPFIFLGTLFGLILDYIQHKSSSKKEPHDQ